MNKSQSPNFKNRKYHNLSFTPTMAKGYSFLRILKEQLHKPKTVVPSYTIPSIITDLKSLHQLTTTIIWFGHSSYLINYKEYNILVDPVFSAHASPIPGMVKAFAGTNIYKAKDMPLIDIMIITHNHYDHLDINTLKQLLPSTKFLFTALGVGKDIPLIKGQAGTVVEEMDWWDQIRITEDITLTATPARHFSGRGLLRGGSLWASFVLELFGHNIFIGGDSGYDAHFKNIGDKYGPFDIVLLECGQYNDAWPNIHMMPEETVQAAIDLGAKVLMPVHWAKFSLSTHPWNEPIERVFKCAEERNVAITAPKIGEQVIINKDYPKEKWW